MTIIGRAGRRLRAIRSGRMAFRLASIAGLAIAGGMLSLPAGAQSTTAHIFGQAPAGETVVAQSNNGFHRHATVDADGHYNLFNLSLSVYTVSLLKDGKAVDTRTNIPLTAGRGAEVDFACPNDHCAAASGS
ncbi:carboxypeptidase-like regulatory domain-containing protein [Rhodanobacter sp. DHG33]|uniref:carboxypeptidase-like regulatory domain-containing protein n=1 Tax=Rhodanobacter sp. DHG33 TaxID=2775921 RepID=UPI001781DD9B|nr:carboxypeptidase-like regulatory domain-containing protein [Rhodanobacter sp. DHG33]MBD8898196.1 carboxypeptidase regulatory-like domain-containing protein [Rhodanobacter sp. DHG33]